MYMLTLKVAPMMEKEDPNKLVVQSVRRLVKKACLKVKKVLTMLFYIL